MATFFSDVHHSHAESVPILSGWFVLQISAILYGSGALFDEFRTKWEHLQSA